MTIKEVSEKYHITQDTLRYYERVGMIPKVTRTPAVSGTTSRKIWAGWSLPSVCEMPDCRWKS